MPGSEARYQQHSQRSECPGTTLQGPGFPWSHSQPSPIHPFLTFSFFRAFSSSSSAFRASRSFRDLESFPLPGDKLPRKTARNKTPDTALGDPQPPGSLRERAGTPHKSCSTHLDRFLSLSRRCPSLSLSRSFLPRSRSRSLCRRSLRDGGITASPHSPQSPSAGPSKLFPKPQGALDTPHLSADLERDRERERLRLRSRDRCRFRSLAGELLRSRSRSLSRSGERERFLSSFTGDASRSFLSASSPAICERGTPGGLEGAEGPREGTGQQWRPRREREGF